MSIAALTSTISSTEVPVAYLVEDKAISRKKATWLVSAIVFCSSMLLIAFFDVLFGAFIKVLTTIVQPLSCLFYFIVVGWLWNRGNKLRDKALQQGRVLLSYWGNYLRFVCPILLSVVFINVAILN